MNDTIDRCIQNWMAMHTVALISQKGGVSKTTLAVSLAVAAHQDGKAACVFDIDEQASAASWGDRRDTDPTAIDAQAPRLPKALDKARQAGIELAFIDTPAGAGQAASIATENADLILVPARPSYADLECLPQTKRLVDLAGKPALALITNTAPTGQRGIEAKQAAEGMGFAVAETFLSKRVAHQDALGRGEGVTEYEPHGRAAQDILGLYREIHRCLNN